MDQKIRLLISYFFFLLSFSLFSKSPLLSFIWVSQFLSFIWVNFFSLSSGLFFLLSVWYIPCDRLPWKIFLSSYFLVVQLLPEHSFSLPWIDSHKDWQSLSSIFVSFFLLLVSLSFVLSKREKEENSWWNRLPNWFCYSCICCITTFIPPSIVSSSSLFHLYFPSFFLFLTFSLSSFFSYFLPFLFFLLNIFSLPNCYYNPRIALTLFTWFDSTSSSYFRFVIFPPISLSSLSWLKKSE